MIRSRGGALELRREPVVRARRRQRCPNFGQSLHIVGSAKARPSPRHALHGAINAWNARITPAPGFHACACAHDGEHVIGQWPHPGYLLYHFLQLGELIQLEYMRWSRRDALRVGG